MARILVVFGTTDGHTAKIARAMAATFRAGGIDTDVVNAAHGKPNVDAYDGIVVAASVHARGYQRQVKRWVHRQRESLSKKPTAFVSVCLGVLQHNAGVQRELATIVEKFLRSTGWQPTTVKTVAGALLYTQYNFIKRWVMRWIVRKAGGDTDTTRDYEYTDWKDLAQFAKSFADGVRGGSATKVA
jgi:menaquinone-dependent protoporphyrinogen oxidase